MHSQNEMKQMVLPLLNRRGKTYQKFLKTFARKAKAEETIVTRTSDGKETINRAYPGDYIVRNQTKAGEEYVLTPSKFKKRYSFIKRSKGGFSEYQPTGRIRAIKVTPSFFKKNNLGSPFYFIADWGEKMVVKQNDYLACPVGGNEVYRIARKEFSETYKMER
ncbi:MAG: hypothetical protein AAF573_14490 [Bacteroidota bacterium]